MLFRVIIVMCFALATVNAGGKKGLPAKIDTLTELVGKLTGVVDLMKNKVNEIDRRITELNATVGEKCTSKTPTIVQTRTCPDGWVSRQGSCYLFAVDYKSQYSSAKGFCQQQGANLVVINDAAENEFLRGIVRKYERISWWTGLTDMSTEGDWRWDSTNGVPAFTSWGPGEPDFSEGRHIQDCAVMHPTHDYRWADDLCSLTLATLCEKQM